MISALRLLVPLAVTALLAACNAASDRVEDPSTVDAPTSAPSRSSAASEAVRTIEVTYADGSVTPRAFQPKVPLGAKVHLVVHADISNEVHVHIYDRKAEIMAGVATLDFTADIPGLVDVELEGRGFLLLQLQVG